MATLPAVAVTGAVIPAAWGNDTRTALTENPAYIAAAQADLFYAAAAGVITRLPKGTARQALLMNSAATAPEWGASLASLLTATGDLPHASAANTPARLPIGSTGQVLMVSGGVPTWAAVPPPVLSTASTARTSDFSLSTSMGDVLSLSLAAGTWLVLATLTFDSNNQGASVYPAKLWDGTNVASSVQIRCATTFEQQELTLAGIVSPGSTTTWKVSAASGNGTGTGLVKATTSYLGVTNKATTMWAVQIG